MAETTFADKQLAEEMGSFKEPAARLKEVVGEGAAALAEGELDKALFLGMQQLALAKLCYEDPSTENKETMMAEAHYNLSVLYTEMVLPRLMTQGQGEQSLFHAQKALTRVDPRKTGEGEFNDLVVQSMVGVARALIQRSDPKCVNYLQRALVMNNELNGPDHPSNFRIHEGLGDFYVLLGDSRALYEATTGKKDGGAVNTSVKKKTEPTDYEKAMDEYANAYSKCTGSSKGSAFAGGFMCSKDARMGDMMGHAAKTRSKMGNEKEAAVIYDQAVSCHESASKPNKTKIAQMCYELGATYHKLKQYSYSKSALDRGLSWCSGETEGETYRVMMLLKKQQAITMYDGNEVDNARMKFEELLALQKKEYGGTSVIVAETLKYLGDVRVALKNKPLASKFYNRALRILRERLGTIDPTTKQLEQYIKQLRLKD